MATQVNKVWSHAFGGLKATHVDMTLITSGTTVTFSLPAFKKVYNIFIHNVTTNEVNEAGGTYTASTGAYVSPAITVNDNVLVTFITD